MDSESTMQGPERGQYDVIIIGAGLSSIAAGIRLSQFFDHVLIAETHYAPGGLNSWYEAGDPPQLFSSGLHTMTNARVSSRKWGLGLIARNLEIDPRDFEIYEPSCPSRITVPGCSVKFSNDPQLLVDEIASAFPGSVDEFLKFQAEVVARTADPLAWKESARHFLSSHISSSQLADLLALSVFTYAGYAEDDIDLRTFSLLYRSIFLDGCGSPVDMKQFLDKLIARFMNNGGELCYRCKVREITHSDGRVTGVRIRDGREIRAPHVLSSAGLFETGQLAGMQMGAPGDISLFQVASCYDVPLAELGIQDSVHFLSRSEPLTWKFRTPAESLQVITFSAQDSYVFDSAKHQFKISCFDHADHWMSLPRSTYRSRKEDRRAQLCALAGEIYKRLDHREPFYTDTFSPATIRRYTAHTNGTLYGGRIKTFDGSTPVENLTIIGNDQGGIGIMGALTSGVLMANYRVLTQQ